MNNESIINNDLKTHINDERIEPGVPKNHDIIKNNNVKLITIYSIMIILTLVSFGCLGIYLKKLWDSSKKVETVSESLMIYKDKEDDTILKSKQSVAEENELLTEINNDNNEDISEEVNNIITADDNQSSSEIQENPILQRQLLGELSNTDDSNENNEAVITSAADFSNINADFRLSKGKNLTCTLQTKINTTYPGVASCILTNDVYSDNGNTLLLEKGSMVIGQQRSALINGQARVFIIWERIQTPNDVIIKIDSGGADALGAPGSEANVNNHFFKRLGGAILLSLVGEAVNYGKDVSLSHHQKAGSVNNTNYGNSTSEITSLAQEILQQNINIPPTAEVTQGTIVNIMLAKDLDFSNVYDLQ